MNGLRAQRARSAGSPASVAATSTGFTTTDATYASFKNASSIEVAMDNDWKHVRCPLASVSAGSAGGSVLTVLPSCWSANNLNVPSPDFPWCGVSNPPLALSTISWVENAYELLTLPGQFYLDQAAGYLYYAPPRGERTSRPPADVELPVLETSSSPWERHPRSRRARERRRPRRDVRGELAVPFRASVRRHP